MISLYDRLKKGKVVVVDIETSGLFCGEEGKENAYILEIAALRLDHFHEAERFHSDVACPVSLPEEISALTGITEEALAGIVALDVSAGHGKSCHAGRRRVWR